MIKNCHKWWYSRLLLLFMVLLNIEYQWNWITLTYRDYIDHIKVEKYNHIWNSKTLKSNNITISISWIHILFKKKYLYLDKILLYCYITISIKMRRVKNFWKSCWNWVKLRNIKELNTLVSICKRMKLSLFIMINLLFYCYILKETFCLRLFMRKNQI